MNQYDVETFLSVVHTGSFSRAAALLYTTQATISHRIGALEKELGYPLLLRNQGLRKIELTYQGERFVPLAEQWSALWNNSRAIRDADYCIPLLVGATNRLNSHFLASFYGSFSQRAQGVVLEVRSYHSVEIYDLIDRKELDVGFVSNEIAVESVASQPFLRERVVMICHQGGGYPPGPIHPSELRVADEVRLAANQKIVAWHDMWWDRAKQPYIYADTAALVAHLLKEARLWSACPYSVARELGELFPIEIHEFSVDAPHQVSFLLCHRTPRMEKKAVLNGFISEFRQYYRSCGTEGFCL